MRGRTRTLLVRSAQSLALGGVFSAAVVGGIVLHADLRATRRLVAAVANEALASQFQGRIVVGEVSSLALGRTSHAHVQQAEILDPEGRRVIFARGIDARIDLARLLRSIAAGGATTAPDVALEGATIDDAEVVLDRDAAGELLIARTFLPRPSAAAAPQPPATAAKRSEIVRLSIPRAKVHHAWVHGNVVPPQLDATADAVVADVAIAGNRLTVELIEGRATMRAPRAPGQAGDVAGSATGSLAVPLASPGGAAAGLSMRWRLVGAAGEAGALPLKAEFGMEGDRLDGSVDVASAPPEAVKRVFPALPVARPIELHAKAKGTTKALDLHLVTDGTLSAEGRLELGGDQPFRLDAELARVDAAAYTGPASDVSGRVHVEGVLAGGKPTGTFRVVTREATLAGQRVPAIDAEGAFDLRRVTASFRATELGVTLEGTAELRVPEETVGFDVHARSRDLRQLARAPGVVAGSATAHATGTIDLARASVAARVTADGAGLARAPVSLGSLHAEATVTGPLAAPMLDVTARAADIHLAAGSGQDDKAPLSYPSATAHARVALVPTPRLLGGSVHVDASADGAAIDARFDELRLGGGGVDVRGAHVTGLGAPLDLDLEVSPGAISLRAKGKDLAMRRVAAMTGIKELRLLPEDARATVDIDVRSTNDRADGHFDLSVLAGDGTAAELHAKLDGRHVLASGRAALGTLGWVEIARADLTLEGAPSARTLPRATGVVDLRGELDLSQGGALLGGESVEQLSGRALLSARVERGDPALPPSVTATARTERLDVTLNRDGVSTHVGGIDVMLHGAYDGASNETEAAIVTWDPGGVVASAGAKARVPLFAWLTGAAKPDRDALTAIELGGVLDVPARPINELPGILARRELRGAVGGRALLSGTLAHPTVSLRAHADSLANRPSGRAEAGFAPIDAALEARWDGTDVVATLIVDEEPHEAKKGAQAAAKKSGRARGLVIARVPVADLLASRPLGWNASAELDVADLELGPLPLPYNLRGALTSRIKVRDLTSAPVLDVRARVDGLMIAAARVAQLDVRAEAKDGSVRASARVRQDDGGTGTVKLDSSALAWSGTTLGWDAAKPTRIDYALDRMQLAILRPFVRRAIPELEGRVDGRGSASVDKDSQVFEGGLSLSQGRLYVNALGEEITEVSAVARFEKNGGFRIVDGTGKIGAGELKVSANGRMKGLRFESAEAVVVVPSKDGVPLSAEGATFAQANGEVRLEATLAPNANALLVTVAVPRARVTVPDRGTQKLQSLEPNEAIAIGVRQPDGSLAGVVERPGAAKRTKAAAAAALVDGAKAGPDLTARFTVTLGEEIELEGRGVKLGLGGRTIVDLSDEIAVSGQIVLKSGGTIDVQGHKFVVDHGTVTFLPSNEPGDPIVVAAAYWDAPDRTRVWVEFNGPLKTGKLTLRSEPPYSKNEILSVLLFGRPDPNQATQGERPSDAQQATALGTGIASSGLNKALGELDDDFDLEQDKTSANRIRTKLGYRLRRNLKVQVGYASGFSQREPDTTYLFLEWQFVPKWSLIGTRGDRGTSILDALFQHRY